MTMTDSALQFMRLSIKWLEKWQNSEPNLFLPSKQSKARAWQWVMEMFEAQKKMFIMNHRLGKKEDKQT